MKPGKVQQLSKFCHGNLIAKVVEF